MNSEIPPHEKIRFRRGEVTSLDQLPSAVPVMRKRRTIGRRIVRSVLGFVALFALVAVLAIGALVGGFGDERLRTEAQSALVELSRGQFTPTIGSTSVSLDGVSALALRADDVRIAATGNDEVLRIGSVRLGLRVAPLTMGDLRINRVTVADARLDLGALPQTDGKLDLPFFDADGVLNPDATIAFLFDGARELMATLNMREVDRIAFENVEIVSGSGDEAETITLQSAAVTRSGPQQLALSASLEFGGRTATIEGLATIDQAGERVHALSLMVDAPEVSEGVNVSGLAARFASATATFGGSQTLEQNRFTLSTQVEGLNITFGKDVFEGDLSVDATAEKGSDKIEINRLLVATGRSAWNFHGAIGPTPREEGPRRYRFELVSDGSTVAPSDSPEGAARVIARIAGHLASDGKRLNVEEIAGRTAHGEISGHAALEFVAGKAPAVDFRIAVRDMPVSETKQFWPWFSASSARRWVMENVFGGHVEEGFVELKVPAGRFGNGVPLGPEEVLGRFAITGARFDMAGNLPPVRDAIGSVDFRGTDVDIALKSGTAYMANDRTVVGTDGTLTIRQAHIKPVIGKLEIAIAGNADAVLQLATYDPINVSRFIDLAADDMSGTVKGRVEADIPLHRDIPVDTLGWRIALDYEGLSIAREFEGQKVTDAAGKIVVDPARAIIEAKAKLNGAQATLNLVEPLGKDKTSRKRNIEMQLDDATRKKLAPGLDAILSGNATLKFDHAASGSGAVELGLDRTTLSLPWVGWSKGTGVPAKASFVMQGEGKNLNLNDFKLQGESFGATGTVSLADGALQRARFSSARLMRGDDFSLDVAAKGRGYSVTIRGKSIDARSVVKLYTGEGERGEGGTGGGTSAPISIDLQVDAMSGFHGETLRNVRLIYAGTAARTDRIEFSAITASGRPVGYVDNRNGSNRRIDMNTTDAGAVLRFLELYEYMRGGEMALSLIGQGEQPMQGQIDAKKFWIVNEPRLSSLVSSTPPGDSRSLNQAVRRDIDTQSVEFERGYARIRKSEGGLTLDGGVLRGPLIGMSFQGTVYDARGNVAMTGTFMPAYGLNRIFGEIPILGQILGNGRDRGLIGITFRLAGRKENPQLEINPLSVIAPGIFRSIFEFN